MGSELVSDLPENQKKMSMTEIFWEAYPAYLSMGMSSDEYWNGDARACRAYRKKRETELRLQDEMLHRQGAYFYHALIAVAPYLNSFKPQQPDAYIQPLSHMEKERERKEAEQKQINNNVAMFQAWAESFNQSRKKNNGGLNQT